MQCSWLLWFQWHSFCPWVIVKLLRWHFEVREESSLPRASSCERCNKPELCNTQTEWNRVRSRPPSACIIFFYYLLYSCVTRKLYGTGCRSISLVYISWLCQGKQASYWTCTVPVLKLCCTHCTTCAVTCITVGVHKVTVKDCVLSWAYSVNNGFCCQRVTVCMYVLELDINPYYSHSQLLSLSLYI